MAAALYEWINLIVRWIHVLAAIMWIGDSFLFMWLDSHLEVPTRPREGAVVGELWMTHSGGFYEVVKRKYLAPRELPTNLYWFKWESYSTWITGFILLIVVFYTNNALLLVDPHVANLKAHEAIAASLGLLAISVMVYEILCRVVGDRPRLMAIVGLGTISLAAFATSQLFSPRAVFLQVGAMLGTCMAANVFFRIIPAQRNMLAATRAGVQVDVTPGLRAKVRSRHNHYLTLPVLFTMLSSHFPRLYAHPRSWLVLVLLFVFGAGLKYVMNFRLRGTPLVPIGALASLGAAFYITLPPPPTAISATIEHQPPVSFQLVQNIISLRCISCHAKVPSNSAFVAPPAGLTLETPHDIQAQAQNIYLRTVQTKTMPLANMTQMTDDERVVLGRWIMQGAKL